MSGVATQPPPAGPPGPQEPPPTTNGGGPGPEAPDTNGGPPAPGQTNGPPHGQGGRGPASAATAAQTQKMLDENSSLISTISEYQKMGRHNETMSYQVKKGADASFYRLPFNVFCLVAAAPKLDAAGTDG